MDSSKKNETSDFERLRDSLLSEILPSISRRLSISSGSTALGIFECEDYKCSSSFTCTDYKCSGGGFKCQDTFKISSRLSWGGSGKESSSFNISAQVTEK